MAKYVNVGVISGYDTIVGVQSTVNGEPCITISGVCSIRGSEDPQYYVKKYLNNENEIWFSFDVVLKGNETLTYPYLPQVRFSDNFDMPFLAFTQSAYAWQPQVMKKTSVLYTAPTVINFANTTTPHNIEVHYKAGADGRIDMWFNHKLIFSYRSPSDFSALENIPSVTLCMCSGGSGGSRRYNHFIISTDRRIGYEKFKKLTIDPSTEQNIEKGGSVDYTLSDVTTEEDSAYTEITGVLAVIQPTSRDANISTGTFTLDGADIGEVDVSDSSGLDYVQAYAPLNTNTGAKWKAEDIEGKTLTLTVN